GIDIAGREQFVRGLVDPVNRPQAVNDMTVGQLVPTGDHGLPRANGRERPALALEARARGSVNGARHATADAKLGVGRVDDGVEVGLSRDIATYALDRDAARFKARHDSYFPSAAR